MSVSKNKPKGSQKPSIQKISKSASLKSTSPASKGAKGKEKNSKVSPTSPTETKAKAAPAKTVVKNAATSPKSLKSAKSTSSTKVVAEANKIKPLAASKAAKKTESANVKRSSTPASPVKQVAKALPTPKATKSGQATKSIEKTNKISSSTTSVSGSSKEKKAVQGKLVATKGSSILGRSVDQELVSSKKEKLQEKPVAIKKHSEPIPPPSNTKPEIVAKIRQAQAEKELRKDLAQKLPKGSLTPITELPPFVKGKDRLILMVRDPYWLHAHWDITRQTVDRAKASLAENWHTVKPILRLLKMDDSGTTSNAETVARDIEIHGGVRNWYIEVDNPPSRFRMLMGYITAGERFFELARSNTVVTPAPGGKSATDDHWADIAKDAEHIYAMSGGYGDDTQTGDLTEVFEEQLKRTMDADVLSQFGSGAEGSLKRHKHFHFDVDAELIVFGSTHPEAHVAVGTEPVKVRTDGSFSIRLPLPDRRQVLAATAKSRDGVDEQTVVIAVERNTKVMEPLSMDTDDM